MGQKTSHYIDLYRAKWGMFQEGLMTLRDTEGRFSSGLPETPTTLVPKSFTWLERWGLQSFLPQGAQCEALKHVEHQQLRRLRVVRR